MLLAHSTMDLRRGQLCASLLLLSAFSSVAENDVSRIRSQCGHGMFQCQNGGCLSLQQVCDGTADCSDRSDENKEICWRPLDCDDDEFRCGYGACIAASKKCNGKQDCVDNSDELLLECSNSKPVNGTCLKQWFHCNSGECIDDVSRCDGAKDCKDGSDETLIQCSALSCTDAFFRCGYGACVKEDAVCDGTIQCEGDGSDEAPELCGTSPAVSQPKKSENLQEECGITVPNNQPYILDGTPVLTMEFPWHVGIYSNQSGKFEQICGGSIIKRKLVVTAAHCFIKSSNPRDYMIGAGKYHRGWDINDPTEQQLEVESIEIDKFRGMGRNYADDIAVIVLKNEITTSDFVRPVCLDLESKYEREQLSAGNLGSIVQWGGYTFSGEPNDTLQITKLPFIEFRECFNLVPSSFRPYISSEKFCAGYVNGPTICAGGGGGGLSFKQEVTAERKQWFIQGIASLSVQSRGGECTQLPILFTQVNKHMNWLKTYYDKY